LIQMVKMGIYRMTNPVCKKMADKSLIYQSS
jgi:hypothetical protein